MEALNVNSILIKYVILICVSCVLTLLFGRKMPLPKKIMTSCALVLVFIIGLPIADLMIQYFAQTLITQDRYEWIKEHPYLFYTYKILFSLLYPLILSGIFLQRNKYYSGRLSLVIPITLFIIIGGNYLISFMVGGEKYFDIVLPNIIGIVLISIALLMIILILRSSKTTKTQNPEFGTLAIFLVLLIYVVVFIFAYDKGLLQQRYYYSVSVLTVAAVQMTMLSSMLITSLFLLRYIAYQNPEYFPSHFNIKFTLLNRFSLKIRLLIVSGSVIVVGAALAFLVYMPFEDHVKQAWLDDSSSRRNNKTCLSVPVRLVGDLEWTLSIPKVDPVDQKSAYYREDFSHEQKISQLDALVHVGFLQKIEEDILIEVKGEQRYVSGFRYHIMPKMTAYSTGGNQPCLHYTDMDQQFLGIDSTIDLMKNYDVEDRDILKKLSITDYVEVSFFVGIEDKYLFPWVKNPEVSKAFNVQHKKQHTIRLAKVYGTWMAAEDLRVNALKNVSPAEFKREWDAEMLRKQYDQRNRSSYFEQAGNNDKNRDITIYPHQIESGDFPQKSKVLETFKREYQSGNVGNPFWYHLAAARVPTDVRTEQGRCESYSPYKVGIITDPEMKRNRQDNIILYSLPYLQDMVKRGILYSYEGQITLKDQSYPGIYFEPTKLYDEAFGLCLNLHEPRFEMLKARSYSSSSLHFDTVAYYERPYWATDEMLENFEELRLMLEYGDTNIARNPAYDLPYIVRKTPIKY